jgi:hypothetical protein
MPQGRFSLADIDAPAPAGKGAFSLDAIESPSVGPTADEAAVVAASPAARAQQPFSPAAPPSPSLFEPPPSVAAPAPPEPVAHGPVVPVATRGRFTGLPVPDVTSQTPNPVVDGAIQMARGTAALAQHAPANIKKGLSANPADWGVDDTTVGAAADLLEGAMKVGSPLVIAGALADLPATVVGLGASYAASAAAGRVAEQAGASPEAQRFTRALAGAATAVLSGRAVIESAKTNTSAMARALTLAAQLSGKTVGEARPVGVGTVAEAAAETQPTAHAPIAAATAKLRDLPTDVGETFGELVDTARAPEPPELRFAQGPDRAAGIAAKPVEGKGAFNLADITPVDAGGRALGGYAGPERRGENTGPPTGVDERRGAVIARVAEKLAAGEPLGTDEARAAFAERQRVDAARGANADAQTGEPYENTVVHITTPEGATGIRQQGFDVSKTGGIGGDTYGPGVYLADRGSDVGSYWRQQLATKNETGEVPTEALTGRVALTHALVVEDMKPAGPRGVMRPLDRRDIVAQYMPDRLARFDALVDTFGGSKNRALGQVAREAGYDGLVFQRRAGDEIVAFNPTAATFDPKDGPRAIQEPSGTAVDVRQQAGDGEAVGGGDAEHQGAAGASPPEEITPQQAALGALSTGDLHALVDHPETPEPLAHEAVSELMAREEEPTHVPVVRWRANPADQDTKSLKVELQALNDKPGRTPGLSPDADPVFSDDERARYNAIQAELAKRKNKSPSSFATDEGPTPPKFNKRQLNDAFAAALQPFKGSDGRWYFVDRRQPNFAEVHRLDEDKFPATVRGFYPGAGYYHDAIPNVTFEGTYEELPGHKYPTSPTKAEHEAAREQPTSYVLPSFVTAGHAKPKPPKQAIPTTEPLVLAQAEAAMQAATHVQVNKQWQPFGGAQKYHATNNIHNRFSRPDPEALWHIEKVALTRAPWHTVVAVTVRTYDSTSGKPQAAQGDTYRFQVPTDFTLPTTAEGRKVEEAAHAEGPVPQSDRGALAGAPTEDGQGARAEGAPESGRGARGAADVGSGGEPHPAGRVADAGAGADAGAVGVPAERGGRPDTPERRPGDLAAEADRLHVIDARRRARRRRRTTRIAANLAAIETLKRIEGENRAATPDEQRVLAKYVGWGGLAQRSSRRTPTYEKLKAALTDEEYRSARASTPNAHYTSPTVIRAVYDALARLGVRGPTRFLEPAAGVGHFLGLMPPELAAQSTRHAVELDAISGRITRALYPNAKVQVTGFERAKLPDGHFDLVVSNVPFGNYQVADKAFKGRPKTLTSSIHNYYFAKALDLVRPGGLVAFITSHYTLDAQDPLVREYLADRANLLGAIRLPNTAFKGNAGTEVVTDLILLQKRGDGIPAGNRDWVQTEAIEGGHRVNRTSLSIPSMVLGTHATTGSMYSGNEYTVEPSGDLAEQLRAAVAHLPQGVYTRPTTTATSRRRRTAAVHVGADWGEARRVVRAARPLYTNEQGTPSNTNSRRRTRARARADEDPRHAARDDATMLDPAATDADVKRLQRTLDKTYDAFVRKHGYLARPKNYRALREDPDVLHAARARRVGPEGGAAREGRDLHEAHAEAGDAGRARRHAEGSAARLAQRDRPRRLGAHGGVDRADRTRPATGARRARVPRPRDADVGAGRSLPLGQRQAKLKAAERAASTSAQYTRTSRR